MIDVSMTQLQSSVSRTRGADTKACELGFEDVGFTRAETAWLITALDEPH